MRALLTLVTLGIFALAGCQMPNTTGAGSVRVVLPTPKARTVTANNGYGDVVRIQLVRSGVIVPLSGQSYLQQSMAGQTVTLDSIPVGTGYQLYVATGQLASSGFFEVAYYQVSSSFAVTAGAATAVSVTLNSTPIVVVEDTGTSYSHAAVAYGPIANISANTLYFLNGTTFDYVTGNPAAASSTPGAVASTGLMPTGTTVYSLSYNSTSTYPLWLNTAAGIYTGTTSSGLNSSPLSAPTTPVYGAGIATLSAGSVEYYYGSGTNAGLMGVSSTASIVPPTSWTALGNTLTGVAGDGANYAYVATGAGTFVVPSSSASTLTPTTLQSLSQLSTSDGATINLISTYSDKSSVAYTFAGTSKGLYAAPVAPSSGTPTSSDGKLDLISGTSGLSITSLATAAYDSGSSVDVAFTAAYSATTGQVLIFLNQALAFTYPTLAGLPSGTPTFTWYIASVDLGYSIYAYTLYLVIAGTDATVAVPIGILGTYAG